MSCWRRRCLYYFPPKSIKASHRTKNFDILAKFMFPFIFLLMLIFIQEVFIICIFIFEKKLSNLVYCSAFNITCLCLLRHAMVCFFTKIKYYISNQFMGKVYITHTRTGICTFFTFRDTLCSFCTKK